MLRRTSITVLLTGALLAAGASAEAPSRLSLQWLEDEWADARGPSSAELHYEESSAHAESVEAESGWKLFLNTGVGRHQEPQIVRKRRFTRSSIQAGLRYPLLGRRSAERSRHRDARLRAVDTRAEAELHERRQRAMLREAYVNLWYLQERRRLAEAHSAEAMPIERLLLERHDAGELRSSVQHRLLSDVDDARLEARLAARQAHRVHSSVAALVPSAPGTFRAEDPALAEAARRWSDQALSSHPSIERSAARQSLIEERSSTGWRDAIDADVVISGTFFNETDLDPSGHDAFVGFSVEVPLGIGTSVRARRAEHSARQDRAARERAEARQRLRRELEAAWSELERRSAAAETAAERLRFAGRAQEEQAMRAARLGGPAIADWLDARSAYFRAGRTWIDARYEALQAAVDYLELAGDEALAETERRSAGAHPDPGWRALGNGVGTIMGADLGSPSAEQTQEAGGEPRGAREARPGFATYLWDSTALFDPARRGALLERLEAAGVTRILVGLTREQIEGDRRRLEAGLEAARAAGLTVELLLGDPHWMRPRHRDDLLSIIARLEPLPFERLHLDIEPEQLEPSPSAETQRQWIATLAAAAGQSPWPVAISIHPRWFEHAGEAQRIPGRIAAAGVEEVVLMIYVRNQDAVTERVRDISGRHPGVRFALAQSAEAELPPENSYADLAHDAFLERMSALEQRLDGMSERIYLQGWADVEALER